MCRIVVGVLMAAMTTGGCGARSPADGDPPKLVILGLSGLDPELTERWMGEGKLPHLAALAAEGGFHRLETSHDADTPTAWASFATGMHAGKHNIFGSLTREPDSYRPVSGLLRREPPRFLFDTVPVARERLAGERAETSFWVTAGHAGIRSTILAVPLTFPPETVPNGTLLSGQPLPDVRGTAGSYAYFASDLEPDEEGPTPFGGHLTRLVFEGREARAALLGPPNPNVRQQLRELQARADTAETDEAARATLETLADERVPFTVTWNHEARTANVNIQGQTVHLNEQQWSRWVELDFRINPFVRVRGMTQLYLEAAGEAVRLYAAPIHWHPASPPADMSAPPSFARDLFERLGPYRTLGWAEATWALQDERIDEQTFLDDLHRAFDDRTAIILNRVDARDWQLLVGVVETADRAQHMLWRLIDTGHPMYDAGLAGRFGGAIEHVYRRLDEFVGDVRARLDEGTAVLVLSDHGSHSFRHAVDLNAWLADEGYLALRPPEVPASEGTGGRRFPDEVDWPRTRAYALGFGQIYANLRGREVIGTVAAGQEHDALLEGIASGLLALTDPQTQTRVVRTVRHHTELFHGPYADRGPDLLVGLAPGYRVSWETALGGIAAAVIAPNRRKWSGDHAGIDTGMPPGVLIMNRPAVRQHPHLVDIAPTVLKFFGLPVPDGLDGEAIF
jgi:predicted AlkP superfamily phosphohydrolase/phosphomutase